MSFGALMGPPSHDRYSDRTSEPVNVRCTPGPAARETDSEAVGHLDLAEVGPAGVVVDGTGADEPAPRIQRLCDDVGARHLEDDLGLAESAGLVQDRAHE